MNRGFKEGDFDDLNILIVGDAIDDHYLFGKIERQNPEAPVPLVRVTDEETTWGGVCNVFSILKKLGAKTTYLRGGPDIESDLCCLPKKMRIIVDGKQVLRFDIEPRLTPLTEKDKAGVLAVVGWLAPVLDGIIVSDYAKGQVCGTWLKELPMTCPGVPIFIDGHPANYHRYPLTATLKINHRELKEITQLDSIQHGVDIIKKDHDVVIVTCGENGTVYFDNGRPVACAPVFKRRVYDVTGAGDAWMAAFVPAFLVSKKMTHAVDFANLVAGISVEKIGSYHPTWDEIKKGHADNSKKEETQ